jgi:hypothetical protein
MLNDIPYEIDDDKCFKLNDSKPNLDDFFGFIRCKITNPTNYELLPHRKDRNYYPANGSSWEGTYFSEELKFVQSIGYKVELLEGISFTKYRPFDYYVNQFYSLKLEAEQTGDKSLRSIAKLHLNSLYGFFGKSLTQNSLKISKDIERGCIKTIELKDDLFVNFFEQEMRSKSVNVALAAAVTSYARIHMYRYIVKYYEYLFYVDTDSLFLSIALPENEVGSELGMMKHEGEIEYGYFLGEELRNIG